MTVDETCFSQVYSHYYDLIYKSKDYKNETEQVARLIKKYAPAGKKILNVGCGTGNHDLELASKGYKITGIDSSEYMLKEAMRKSASENKSILFEKKDIRFDNIEEQPYDVVLSLFHVMSYLTGDEDIRLAFKNIYRMLNPGGLFIFDFWYAPGILNNLPERRVKLIEAGDVLIERQSLPEINFKSNVVEMKISLGIGNLNLEMVNMSSEVHRVRYFNLEELFDTLMSTGFNVIASGSDYEMNPFKAEDRYATIIARK